jgi:tellurite resistance protein
VTVSLSDDKLLEALRVLGIDVSNLELVALLPLVRVAWADGVIQDKERSIILRVADRNALLGEAQRAVIEGWLEEAPSPFFIRTAFQVVAELVDRAALPEELGPQEVVTWCWALADAAGGLFGTRMMSISPSEEAALQEIAAALDVDGVPDWSEYRSL